MSVVSADLAVALPAVSGDRNQLQQVLLNFMMNGCDAMDGQAERSAGCGCATRQTAQGHVEVSVADRGAGIPPADLERIFEPFVTTKSHGLGLGLAICRSIVEAHGGRLWASNNADRGRYAALRIAREAGLRQMDEPTPRCTWSTTIPTC